MARLSRALVSPEPVLISAPTSDGKVHTFLEVGSESVVVVTVTDHCDRVITLLEFGNIFLEKTVLLDEVDLNVEPVVSVDLVLTTWSEVVPGHVLGIVAALSTSVTVGEMSLAIWMITRVWGGLESELVGLHDVELWAP